MGLSKLPNKETTEDLLNLLETNQVYEKKVKDYSIQSFLKVFNINVGQNRVKSTYLYHLYTKWTKNPVSKQTFSKELAKFFEYVDFPEKTRHFLIDLKAINLHSKTKDSLFKVDKTKRKVYTTHFNTFCDFYQIKKGTFWIEDYNLYYLYDKWTYKNQNKHPLSQLQFNNFCKLWFVMKQQSYKHIKYFGVDKNIINHLTPEHLQQLKEGYHEKRKYKRKSKEDKQAE